MRIVKPIMSAAFGAAAYAAYLKFSPALDIVAKAFANPSIDLTRCTPIEPIYYLIAPAVIAATPFVLSVRKALLEERQCSHSGTTASRPADPYASFEHCSSPGDF